MTDAYTNIATVKLFSHARREAGFARTAMQEFLNTVHTQMRLVTGFEIVNHTLSMALIAATRGRHALAVDAGPGRRRRGRRRHRDGAAPERHLALGDVGDGRRCSSTSAPCRTASTRSRGAHDGRRRAGREAARRRARRHPLRARELRLRRQARRDRQARRCTSARARRSAWSAARAPASRRSSTCCCASTTSRAAAS